MSYCKLALCKLSIVAAVLSAALLITSPALAESAGADAFAKGEKQLAEGDFNAAMQSFYQAAMADRQNREYATEYLVLRQVVQIQSQMAETKNDGAWGQMAQALHSFYSQKRLYDQLLDIDTQLHERFKNGSTATMLAETQLACKEPKAAVEMLTDLPAEKATPSTQALLGLAMSQSGDKDGAKKLAGSIELNGNDGPGTAYRLARLHAAVGNAKDAAGHLTRCFEGVPPSTLPSFKEHAKEAAEFESLVDTDAFKTAMATESKVPESACSTGSSCATCPSRGSCPSAGGH